MRITGMSAICIAVFTIGRSRESPLSPLIKRAGQRPRKPYSSVALLSQKCKVHEGTPMPTPATVELIDPRNLQKNPDNPRLIFQAEELAALEESIREQGILVPLSVYKDGKRFTLLDGERRWRCAIGLGLHRVPAIIQEKPDRVRNIMMMFAIHNARKDWDPLPTALKLEELENIIATVTGEKPSERRLAAAASLSVGEVRRYRKILALPDYLRSELMSELNKSRGEQRLTVDHIL